MCWTHDDMYLCVSTGADLNTAGPILLLDGASPELPALFTLEGHQSTCLCLSADSRGKYLASAAEDNLIALWETESFVQVNTLSIPNQIRQFSFNHNAEYLAVASDSDEILIFDL